MKSRKGVLLCRDFRKIDEKYLKFMNGHFLGATLDVTVVFDRGNNKLFKRLRETFDGMHSSIKWQPVLERYLAKKQKPRGGSRGAYDTQVFPAVSPGRNGVGGRIYSPRHGCVNSSRFALRLLR